LLERAALPFREPRNLCEIDNAFSALAPVVGSVRIHKIGVDRFCNLAGQRDQNVSLERATKLSRPKDERQRHG
jgi:hypothetical protein